MFGFLALGMFASLAFSDGKSGGSNGGIIGSLLGGKTISEFIKSREEKSENDKKEKKEKVEKKENEVKDLLKKNKSDLTPRDIKRLKELQSDSDVDVEEFLTNKELKAFADATGYKPKRDISNIDADDDLTPDEKQDELHDLLKKKPGELTQKQKARLKKLASDPEIDKEDFSDTELKNYKEATGENLSDTPKEDPKALAAADMELEQKKAITLAEREYKEAKGKDDDDSKAFVKAYDSFVKCAYDEDGNLRSPEDFEKAFNDLPDDEKEAIKKNIKSASEDEKVKSEYNTQASNISKEYAEKGAESVKERRVKLVKAEKNKDEIEKYANFEFKDGLTPGDLSSDDEDKKKSAEAQLKEAGLDVDIYNAVQKAKAGKNADGTEPDLVDIAANDDVVQAVETHKKNKDGNNKKGDNNSNNSKKEGDGEGEGEGKGKKEGDGEGEGEGKGKKEGNGEGKGPVNPATI